MFKYEIQSPNGNTIKIERKKAFAYAVFAQYSIGDAPIQWHLIGLRSNRKGADALYAQWMNLGNEPRIVSIAPKL